MTNASSAYIDSSVSYKAPLSNRRFFVATFVMLFAFLMVAGTAIAPALLGGSTTVSVSADEEDEKNNAVALLCGDRETLGPNMKKSDWRSFMRFYPQPDKSGRDWTMQEALGQGVKFTAYTGEDGLGNFGVNAVGKKRGEGIGNFDEKVTALSQPRTGVNCLFNGVGLHIANGMLGVASGINALSQTVAVVAFDSKLICSDAADKGNCINLLRVIGGTSPENGGIIASLTSSIYLPLSVLAVMLAGFYVLWVGIVQRQLRKAFFSVVWIIMSFILGLAMLLNPHILAKAPMAVSNTIAACVIGAFNGQSCAGGDVQKVNQDDNKPSENSSKAICASAAAGVSIEEQMSMSINSLTCSVWRAFVLEPWTQGQFGRSFAKMDVTEPDVAKAIEGAGLQANDFCINLGSTGSVDSQGLNVALTRGERVCNVAAYQAYLATRAEGATSSVDKQETPFLDENWYKVALVAVSDNNLWDTWSMSFGSGFKKIQVGLVAILASVLGGIIIFFVSLMALVYYVTALIMMAFAPLFALIGLHPGRGRAILMGWVELVVSNVMKYIASALFLVVTLALYGGVLSEMENLGLVLVFLFILTVALWLYRKEIIELLGRVNMGGERLSNSFSQFVQQRVDRAKDSGKATIGGALGSVAAAGTSNPMDYWRASREQIRQSGDLGHGFARRQVAGLGAMGKLAAQDAGHGVAAGARGARSGFKRDLRRGSGVVGHAARESDRVQMDNKRDAKSISDKARDEAAQRNERVAESDTRLSDERTQIRTTEADILASKSGYAVATQNLKDSDKVEAKVLFEMRGADPNFVRLQTLSNQLAQVERSIAAATSRGDTEQVSQLAVQRDQINLAASAVQAQITDLTDAQNRFEARMEELHQKQLGVDDYQSFREGNAATVQGYEAKVENYHGMVNSYNDRVDFRNNDQIAANESFAKEKFYGDAYIKHVPGARFSNAKMDKLDRKSTNLADGMNEMSMTDKMNPINTDVDNRGIPTPGTPPTGSAGAIGGRGAIGGAPGGPAGGAPGGGPGDEQGLPDVQNGEGYNAGADNSNDYAGPGGDSSAADMGGDLYANKPRNTSNRSGSTYSSTGQDTGQHNESGSNRNDSGYSTTERGGAGQSSQSGSNRSGSTNTPGNSAEEGAPSGWGSVDEPRSSRTSDSVVEGVVASAVTGVPFGGEGEGAETGSGTDSTGSSGSQTIIGEVVNRGSSDSSGRGSSSGNSSGRRGRNSGPSRKQSNGPSRGIPTTPPPVSSNSGTGNAGGNRGGSGDALNRAKSKDELIALRDQLVERLQNNPNDKAANRALQAVEDKIGDES